MWIMSLSMSMINDSVTSLVYSAFLFLFLRQYTHKSSCLCFNIHCRPKMPGSTFGSSPALVIGLWISFKRMKIKWDGKNFFSLLVLNNNCCPMILHIYILLRKTQPENASLFIIIAHQFDFSNCVLNVNVLFIILAELFYSDLTLPT